MPSTTRAARSTRPAPAPTAPAPFPGTVAAGVPMGATQKASVQLRFGPVSATVAIVSAVAENKDGALRLVCTNTHEGGIANLGSAEASYTPIKRVDSCPTCGSSEHLGRAKEVADGLVPIPAEVLVAADAADAEFGKEISLVAHPAEAVEALTRPTGSRYYLHVKSGQSDNYALLREMVRRRPNLAYMALFALKGAAYGYRLVLDGEALMLVQLCEPSSVRARPVVAGTANETYLDLALTMADASVTPFDPAAYVRPKSRMIAEYIEGKSPFEIVVFGTRPSGEVTDLLSALRASVAASVRTSIKTSANKAPTRTRTPAKKAAAKAPTKATPAKTTAPRTRARKAS